ncbi:uncharacterized protein [Clytia hemisphaerica]|uniref:Uncharacterized protein n=1 Tax=Clytia hemisphaerica TaxID=252671 RepID=A0A7M5XJM0_9CNID
MKCDEDSLQLVRYLGTVFIQFVYFLIIVIYAGVKFDVWWNWFCIIPWIGFNVLSLYVFRERESTENKFLKFLMHKINWSNFGFILAIVAPYGVVLHSAHLEATASLRSQNLTMCSTARTECVTLENDSTAYGILLTVFPIMVGTKMLYPDPEGTELNNLINGFAMLDIIDMAELMFGDVVCFQNYEKGLLGVFYLALVVSALLTTFYSGLEQYQKGEYHWGDFWTTLLSLIFNDILFFALRVEKMRRERHGYFGMIFTCKEGMSCIIRFLLMFTFARN